MPQSQWDRAVRREWLFLGAVLVIGARIAANFLTLGWTKEALEALFLMSSIAAVMSGGVVTARRIAAIVAGAVATATIFEVERQWGWMVAGPPAALTFLLFFQAVRSGILAARRDAPSST